MTKHPYFSLADLYRLRDEARMQINSLHHQLHQVGAMLANFDRQIKQRRKQQKTRRR